MYTLRLSIVGNLKVCKTNIYFSHIQAYIKLGWNWGKGPTCRVEGGGQRSQIRWKCNFWVFLGASRGDQSPTFNVCFTCSCNIIFGSIMVGVLICLCIIRKGSTPWIGAEFEFPAQLFPSLISTVDVRWGLTKVGRSRGRSEGWFIWILETGVKEVYSILGGRTTDSGSLKKKI